jgi:hypothetical protein
MMHENELPRDRRERELKLAFIRAYQCGEPPAAWIGRYPQAARALTDLALALETARRVPAPTPGELGRAAGWLRRALWLARASPRPQ